MDNLIQQLVQIDKDAKQMIDRADTVKLQLDQLYEKKKTDYETQLAGRVEEELHTLSKTLAKQKEHDLAVLHGQTAKAMGTLDKEYQKHHAQLAGQIMQRILAS